MPVVNANSVDPDQTPHFAASDLRLHCLPMSHLWDARHKWVDGIYVVFGNIICSEYIFFTLALSSEKVPSSMHKMCGLTSSCTCAKSHPGIRSPLKRSIVWFCLRTANALNRLRGC